MKKDEAAKVLEALNLAAEVLDELPTWSNTGHAANTAHEAIAIMRREVEPVSDADILALWEQVQPAINIRDEAIAFARALLEKA